MNLASLIIITQPALNFTIFVFAHMHIQMHIGISETVVKS